MDRPLAKSRIRPLFCRAFAATARRAALAGSARGERRFRRRPRQLREIDDWFTAPVCGFGTAENYYRQCSSAPLLSDIRLPTLILAAADDPLVPLDALRSARLSHSTVLRITLHGGHLGFIASRSSDADRRWMDWRVVDWVTAGHPPESSRCNAWSDPRAERRLHSAS